jgi:hypothetical protein
VITEQIIAVWIISPIFFVFLFVLKTVSSPNY